MKFRVIVALVFASSLVVGCTSLRTRGDYVFEGGAYGALAGAATGTAIGAAISNGDIAASALLGAGVGIPVGIIAALIIKNSQDGSILAANNEIIRNNQYRIGETQRQIESERESLLAETSGMESDPSRRGYQYLGPSVGNRYR